jgi:ATP-binding cassette subfamily C protein CydD
MVSELVRNHTLGASRGTLLLGWLVAVAALRAGSAWAQERYAQRAAANVIGDLREQVVTHVVDLGPRWGAGNQRAEVASLLTRGLDDLGPYLTRYLPSLVLACLVTPAALFVVLGLDWVSFAIGLVTLPLIPVFMRLIGMMTSAITKRRFVLAGRMGAQVLDLLSGLPTLRAYGRETGPGRRVRQLGDAYRTATLGTLRVAFLSGMVLELITTLSVAVVAVSVGLRLVEGQMTLFAGLAVIMLAPEIYWPLRQVAAQFHASTNGLEAAAAAFEILDTPLPSGDATSSQGRPAPVFVRPRCAAGGSKTASPTAPLPAAAEVTATKVCASSIVFDGVSVRAGDRAVAAPAQLTMRIDIEPGRGKVVALTGPSGAGKSTAVLLLLGLLQPDSGTVTLPCDDVADWWGQVAWVPQRPAIAPGTLHEVVCGESSPLRVGERDEPARRPGREAVVAPPPQGWDTAGGLAGVGLSVGQRQRVALTAALLARGNRPVVILDEPTAHLDPIGEQVVLDTVSRLRNKGRTVIVIAHRDSLIALADQVIPVAADVLTGGGA